MAMNPIVKNGVAAGVVVAIGWYAMKAHTRAVDDREYQLEVERVKREFVEKSRWVHSVAKPAEYTDELQRLLKTYFADLIDVRNRFPGRGDDDKAMREAEAMVEKGKVKREELPRYREWFEYTRAAYDKLRAGYTPVLTAYDNTLRMDIYRLEREDKDGQARLRMDFVLWGAPRKTVAEEVGGGKKVKRTTVPLLFESMGFKFLDDKGKTKFEMSGGGNPYLKVDNPERWVAAFPPGAVLGTYYLDVFPPAERMQMTMAVQATAQSGSAIPATFSWDVPLREEWKPRPGEKWEGEEREAEEEEESGPAAGRR